MYLHPTWGAIYWPIALTVALVMFTVPETVALVTNHVNTLSDYARWQLNEYAGEPVFVHDWQWFTSQAIFLLLVWWLWGHIWYYVWG
jgi:hypothetical protein